MKIFYLLSSNDSTAYYRGYLPGLFLRELGHEVEFNIDWFDKEPYFQAALSKEEIEAKRKFAESADLIVFQRPGNMRYLAEMFRLKTDLFKRVVIEHDDLLDNIPDLSPFSAFTLDKDAHGLMLEGADMVTCTTNYLHDEFLKYNLNVRVVPNGIDFSLYKPNKKPSDKFRIGLLGSVAFADNQQVIDLKELAAIPNVQIVVLGLPSRDEFERKVKNLELKGLNKKAKLFVRQFKPYEGIENIEFHDFVTIDKYPDKLADLNLDCAIIPRDNSAFNKAKSNIKFLECAALKIPVIAQHFLDSDSPYDIDQKQSEQEIMKLAGWGKPSFKSQIEHLIAHKDEASIMAESAYEYAQAFDIRQTAKLWEFVFLRAANLGTLDFV